MVDFNDRENSEEARFALEQELRFKAKSARNKRLGQWAAELMGLKDKQADEYAREIVSLALAKDGDEAVVRRLSEDFRAGRVARSEHQIRRTMEEMLEEELERLGVLPG